MSLARNLANLKPSTAGLIEQNDLAANVTSTGPAFRAELQATTSLSPGTWTLVPLNTKIFDTASCFNTSTYRYTPNIAGYYLFTANVRVTASSQAQYFSAISKNSTSIGTNNILSAVGSSVGVAGTTPTMSLNTIVYMNGTTDYVCLLGYIEGSSPVFDYNTAGFCNFLSGSLIKAQ